ncbi:MAG: hypothetical protein Q8R20_03555 [Nanoarchaeota archaeon]|nr:hypothetical protein [Nanoarchaeota archaeon]
MNKKIGIVAIIAFVMGFLVAWSIFRDIAPTGPTPDSLAEGEGAATSSKDKVAPSTKSPVPVSTGVSGEGSLSVSDQEFGDSISISSVTLGSAGWIAIHEDRDGGLGNILGAGWFPAGMSENVEVNLLRGTVPGALYHAVLRSDDGDREFDHTKDAPFEDESGKTLETTFRTNPLEVEAR